MSEFALHAVQDARSDQRAEGIADQATARQHSSADTKLRPLVPFRQQEKSSREECSFHKSEEESGKQSADKAVPSRQNPFMNSQILRTHSFVIPVKVDIMPQMTIQTGRYIEGFPM